MNFGNIVIMMSKFGSKSGDFAQRGIEMESVLYTCTNCQKYLQAAQLYAKSAGKTINVKFISHLGASTIPEVKNIIK